MAFECPLGTRFQQRTMVCDHQYMVDCRSSHRYYDTNLRIGQRNLKLIDGTTAINYIPLLFELTKKDAWLFFSLSLSLGVCVCVFVRVCVHTYLRDENIDRETR